MYCLALSKSFQIKILLCFEPLQEQRFSESVESLHFRKHQLVVILLLHLSLSELRKEPHLVKQ